MGRTESLKQRKCRKKKELPYNQKKSLLEKCIREIAWIIAGKRNTYLANWYWRWKSQKGAKRATIAPARKILVVIFNMLKNLVPYDDSTYETLRLKCQKRMENYSSIYRESLFGLFFAPYFNKNRSTNLISYILFKNLFILIIILLNLCEMPCCVNSYIIDNSLCFMPSLTM